MQAVTTASDAAPALPLLPQPLALRGLELRNRIVVSPMATYNAECPASALNGSNKR